ncbi:MAG TPA: transposase zinc-binding domain-containing protein [Syntrophobacteria bacterium]|nr:transposase zinc-binding domain-containing protein [Syntrophobacteria bacterium]
MTQVIYRYLDCGDLHNGFARVKCRYCCHKYLLAFSCKMRHFCPSCHEKQMVEFGAWIRQEIINRLTHLLLIVIS